MIYLSSVRYDPHGLVALSPNTNTDLSEVARRMSRVATLDGGAVLNDAGHWAADRTFLVLWDVESEAQYRAVERLVRLYSLIHVSCPEGFFLAAPSRVRRRDGVGDLELLVMEELSV